MKSLIKSVAFAMFAIAMCIGFASCSEETKGDFLYDITTSDDTSTASYTSYKLSGAESTIFTEVEKVAKSVSSSSTTVIMNGKEKECLKALKAAVDKGMDTVEAKEGYNTFFDLSETTVVIKDKDSKVVYSRTFKK